MANIIKLPTPQSYGSSTFNGMYAMTFEEVDDLVTYLTTSTFIDDIKLLFSSPVENIVALRAYPFDVPSVLGGGGNTPLFIANVNTGISSYYMGRSPLNPISLGELVIEKRFNNFLDYAPYTKIELYLPYIGFVTLDNSLVMGKRIYIRYAVDIFSGKCSAFVSASEVEETYSDSNIIMICDGEIGYDVQIGGGQNAEIARNLLKLGVGVAAGVATASLAGGAPAAGAIATASEVSLVSSTAINAITAMQSHIHKGQCNQPAVNRYSPQECYLVIARPSVIEPTSYAHDYGKPSDKTSILGTLTGFTVVGSVHVEGLATATSDEVTEVERLLKQGVIL